ncbi:MAG TPA: TetR/AcrR family transcriptional regulator [Tetragenococcus sp.]|nr:TetR/AcrR family transcriptional regulator [Tetragenococcus sp.]
MRKIDKNKQRAIKQAVFDLSQSEGLFNMTTAKIAKTAGVSPATIYLYYQDKTDLLSRIYEEVKTNLHDGLDKVINLEDRLDEQVRQTIDYTIKQYRKYPKQAHFMDTLWNNSELLDEKAVEFGNTMEDALSELLDRIQASEEYADVSRDILNSFLSVPTTVLEMDPQMDGKKLELISEMVIKAIKK